MVAQQHSSKSNKNKAGIARLLLEANTAYGESNNPTRRHSERIEIRGECRAALNSLMRAAPDHPAVLGLMGRVEMDDGNLEQARVLYSESLRINPDQPAQYTNLGYWALASERPALAEEYFNEALTLDRQSAAAFAGIAHAKRAQGLFDVAFLHYRKLARLGLEWPSVYSGMLTCASHLSVDQADAKLAQDAITLLKREKLPHQALGHFVAAIIRQQYDLANANAPILLNAACEDELLILALEKTLMPDPAVEDLVAALRRAVLVEVAQTATLREELHPLILALAIYADRTGYGLLCDDAETSLIRAFNQSIHAQFDMGEPMDSLTGSLLISALYGALFHQSFAVQLGQWNLIQWPVALQPLMAASYYNRATEEAIKQCFDEKADELTVDRVDLPQAWPSWQKLALHTESSLKSFMRQHLNLDTSHLPETLRVMVCGAESGQKALELASFLDDVEVIAVDESLANIARATRHAQDMGLENIIFWPWSIARQFVDDGNQVHWVEVGRLPSPAMTDFSLAALIDRVCCKDAVVHLHTTSNEQTTGDTRIREAIARHGLQPTTANIQRLRRMVMNNREDSVWTELLQTSDFYGLGGCRDRWFQPQDDHQLRDVISLLCNEVNWKLVRAQDSDGHRLSLGPVQKQLQAEAGGSDVQTLVGQPLTLYVTRRR